MSELGYKVTLKDGATAVLGKIRAGFSRLGSVVTSAMSGAVRGVGRLFGMLTRLPSLLAGAAITGGIGKAIGAAFNMESMEAQFSVLLGGMDAAKKRVKELQDFSASTPFQLDGIAQASRMMHVFTGGALGGVESLRLVGDAAAAVNQPIEDLGMWIGRAYSAIQGGQPFGQAAMRLQEMGVLSAKGRQEIDALSRSGASSAKIWAVLESEMKSFSGGMDLLSKTGSGLVSTLKDNVKLAMAEFGSAFTDAAKGGLTTLIAKIGELRDNGAIQRFGQRVAQVVKMAGAAFVWLRDRISAVMQSDLVQGLIGGLRMVIGIIKEIANGTTSLGAVLGQLGTIIGASLKLGFLGAVNALASGLEAVIAGLVTGLSHIPGILKESFAPLVSGDFWKGLGLIIIGSLSAVGGFLIKIFTAPLDLLQAGITTIMKGMLNWMAGLGGNKDKNGVGRIGRYLNIGVQENDFDKNLEEARRDSTMGKISKAAREQGSDAMSDGLALVASSTQPYRSAVGAAALDIAGAVKDQFGRSEDLFDTSGAKNEIDAALSGFADRYANSFSVPELPAMESGSTPSGGVAAPSLVALAGNSMQSQVPVERRSSDIGILDRFDWQSAVAAGKSPDEQIAEEAKKMRELLEKIAAAEGVK